MGKKQSWALDGVLVGSAALLAAGTVWLTQPKNSGGMMIAGAIGAGGMAAGVARLREQSSTKTFRRDLQLLDEQGRAFEQRLIVLENGHKAVIPSTLGQNEQRLQTLQIQIERLQDQFTQWQSDRPKSPNSPTSTAVADTPADPPLVSAQSTPARSKPTKKLPRGEFGSKNVEKIKARLQQRGILVTDSPVPVDSVNQDYGQLANYLGENYAALKGLIISMKRSLHQEDETKRNQFVFYPTDESNFALCHYFCKKLYQSFLLSDYKPNAKSRRLAGTLYAEADGLKAFLDGKWFERFTHQKMTQLLTDKGLDHACLLNPRVQFPGNAYTNELDTLFLVEDTLICVECKSGGYNVEDARTFASHCEKMGVDQQNALFVVLDVPGQEIDVQNRRAPAITITNIQQLESHLERALNLLEPDVSPPSPNRATVAPVAPEPLAASPRGPLGKVKYRAVRSDRAPILAALVELFQQPEDPTSPRIFVTVKATLSERTGISKSRINDVLQVLKHAGYFLDEAGDPVTTITQAIAHLKYPDAIAAEQVFFDQYVLNVLQFVDLEFFDSPANCTQFEEIVGAKAPDAATLERLKVQIETPDDDLGDADLV